MQPRLFSMLMTWLVALTTLLLGAPAYAVGAPASAKLNGAAEKYHYGDSHNYDAVVLLRRGPAIERTALGNFSVGTRVGQWSHDEKVNGTVKENQLGDAKMASERFVFAHDALGSIVARVDASNTTATTLQRFDAWGTLRDVPYVKPAAGQNQLAYTGHIFDPETGLSFMKARYYDDRLPRFLSADPLLGDLTSPLTLNSFSYVSGNPTKFTDPTGLFKVWVHKEITRAVLEALGYRGSIATVASWNALQDVHQESPYVHFDASHFVSSVEELNKNLRAACDLTKFQMTRDMALGRAFHAVQDFYSHSNWVELFLGYNPKAKRVPTFEEVFDIGNPSWKSNDGFRNWIAKNDRHIVTGEFNLSDPLELDQAPEQLQRGHGSLSKDQPSSTDADRNRRYELARDAAQRASSAALENCRAFQGSGIPFGTQTFVGGVDDVYQADR